MGSDYYPDDGSVLVEEVSGLGPTPILVMPFWPWAIGGLATRLIRYNVNWDPDAGSFPGWPAEPTIYPLGVETILADAAVSNVTEGGETTTAHSVSASLWKIAWQSAVTPYYGSLPFFHIRYALGLRTTVDDSIGAVSYLDTTDKRGDGRVPPEGYDDNDPLTWLSSGWVLTGPPAFPGIPAADEEAHTGSTEVLLSSFWTVPGYALNRGTPHGPHRSIYAPAGTLRAARIGSGFLAV